MVEMGAAAVDFTLNASTVIVAPPDRLVSPARATPAASHCANRKRASSSSPTTPIVSTGRAGSSRLRSIAMLHPDPPPWRSTASTSLVVSSAGQSAIDLL